MSRRSIVRIALMGALGVTTTGAHAIGFGRTAQAAQPSQDLQRVASQADGWQAGVVRGQGGGTLTIAPYGENVLSQIALDPTVPVFQGAGRISTQGLMSGVDVRVYTQNRSGITRAVGVEVLTPEQARVMRSQPSRVATAPTQQMPQQQMPQYPQHPIAQLPQQPRPVYPVPQQPQPQVPPPAQQMPQQPTAMREDGAQAGKIVTAQSGQLVLDPYEERAGVAYLQLPGDQVRVTNGGMVSVRDLWEGRDVRVHYQQVPGQRPLVVSVELLNQDQARQWGLRDNGGERNDEDRNDRGGHHDNGKHKGSDKQKQRSELRGAHQPGKVLSVRDGYLTIDPYQRAAGDSRLRISSDTPVYRGDERVGIESLQPGADVQVFFDGGRVTAVQLLDHNEANEQRRINENVPRGK